MLGESLRQGGHGVEGVQGSIRTVELVGGNAAALLVGGIHDVQVGVEAHMARPFRRTGSCAIRVARSQLAGQLVEFELENCVFARVCALGDVRHVGVTVGRVGLDVVGANAGLAPLDGVRVQDTVLAKPVHSHTSLVVVG